MLVFIVENFVFCGFKLRTIKKHPFNSKSLNVLLIPNTAYDIYFTSKKQHILYKIFVLKSFSFLTWTLISVMWTCEEIAEMPIFPRHHMDSDNISWQWDPASDALCVS